MAVKLSMDIGKECLLPCKSETEYEAEEVY